MGAPLQAPFEVKRLEASALGEKFTTFELKVQHHNEWLSRRMTIAPLGEESGSKSICFYVIYDDHLVVKIPPTPITDLGRYLEYIYADQRIVFRLEPRECVVPSVSVILKRIQTFPDENAAPEKMEGRYISWLKKNTQFQEYLKIDDTFVFFMDLSRYGILGDILQSLHFEYDGRFYEEILENKGVITNYHAFEGRYGHFRAGLGYDLNKLYSNFESRVQSLLSRNKIHPSTLQYKIEDWFLLNLAGIGVDETEEEVSAEIVAEINEIFEEATYDAQDLIDTYHQIIREYLGRKYFAKSKAQMEGVVTNVLELLAWLREKGVAMRDFKPDNLLVTGDPEKNPNFLTTPKEYKMGLIDLETAVIYKVQGDAKIEQPQLGGTPFFATPAQLFQNAYLEEGYGDLAVILCLQDWYAAVAMIYYVITGERLFEKTAVKLPAIINAVTRAQKEKKDARAVMVKTNKVFWKSAASEFSSNVKEYEDLLEVVQISLPDTAAAMLLDFMRAQRLQLVGKIRERIETQPYFTTEKNREQLLLASSTQIAGLRKKQEQAGGPDPSPKCFWLKKLETGKKELENLESSMKRLVKNAEPVPVKTILEILFQIVAGHMSNMRFPQK